MSVVGPAVIASRSLRSDARDALSVISDDLRKSRPLPRASEIPAGVAPGRGQIGTHPSNVSYLRRGAVSGAVAIPMGPQQDGEPHEGLYRRGAKRLLDLTLLAIALPVVLPLVMILAFLVWRDGGQSFYSQPRVGRGGRVYRIWKLRTMVPDADARLDSYLRENPVLQHEWLTKQKLLNDPRITRVGRVLRKTSLDELPQLFNVFLGDMSLVGPRPMMVSQEEMYPGRAYYRLRPGITGLWQVSDRNATRFSERARYDDEYERNLSLRGDIAILMATVRVVLRGTGH